MEKRCSFELFKSNVCHWLKEEGDIDFLIQVLESDLIRKHYNTLRSKVADLEAMVRRLGQIIREKLPEVYAAITQPKRDRQQPSQKQKPKSRDLER